MLQQFIDHRGLYYCMAALCVLGFIGKIFEWVLYTMLLKQAKNAAESEKKFIKLLKLKIKSCNVLHSNLHNTKAFVEDHLNRYRIMGIRIDRLKTWGIRIMLVCAMAGIFSAMYGVYFQKGIRFILYHIGVSMLSILLLEFGEFQFANYDRRTMVSVMLEDYLDNFSSYQSSQKYYKEDTMISDEEKALLLSDNDIDNEIEDEIKSAVKQVAIVNQKTKDKKKYEQNEEQLIEEIIKEFLS